MTCARLYVNRATQHLDESMADRHLKSRKHRTIRCGLIRGTDVGLKDVVKDMGGDTLSIVFYCYSEAILSIHITHTDYSKVCVACRQCYCLRKDTSYHCGIKVKMEFVVKVFYSLGNSTLTIRLQPSFDSVFIYLHEV